MCTLQIHWQEAKRQKPTLTLQNEESLLISLNDPNHNPLIQAPPTHRTGKWGPMGLSDQVTYKKSLQL